MCQILFCKKENPPEDVLKWANEKNSHGFGFAWSEGGVVKWRKGFESTDLDNVLQEFMEKPFPKAIHFRYATHGGINNELTHPFPIKRGNPLTLEGEAKSVLFHNGVWGSWDDRLREAIFSGAVNPNVLRQPMSDSRAMAVLCQRFGPDILDVLEVGSQKVLVLMHDTWYKYGNWADRKTWEASNHNVERKKDEDRGIIIKKWNNKNMDAKGNLTLTLSPSERNSRYLDADREEVEQSIATWGGRTIE